MDDGNPLGPSGRKTGPKLSSQAKSVIMICIAIGRTNRQINAELRKQGYIPSNDSISDNALTRYRKSKALLDQNILTDEARQVTRGYISEMLLGRVELGRAAMDALLDPESRIKSEVLDEPKLLNALKNVLAHCDDIVLQVFGTDLKASVGGALDPEDQTVPEFVQPSIDTLVKLRVLEVVRELNMGMEKEIGRLEAPPAGVIEGEFTVEPAS